MQASARFSKQETSARRPCGLYVNDIDFFVLFEGESSAATSPHSGEEGGGGGGGAPWEDEPEMRMARAFALLNAMDDAFSVDFVYDEEEFRTAVKVTRLSAARIRFAPVISYHSVGDGQSGAPRLDYKGRLYYATERTHHTKITLLQ